MKRVGDKIISFGRRQPTPRPKLWSSRIRVPRFTNRPWGTRSSLLLIALVGILTVGNLLGYGQEFPTLSEMLSGSGGGVETAATGNVEGPVRVIDGDTLDIGGQRVRLHGIDAPEAAQQCKDSRGDAYRCGQQATEALSGFIGRQPVTCDERDVDRYGRIVAVCRLGTEDVNAWMVSHGWAMAYRHYSLDYVPEEGQARTAHRGIWRGEFTSPWDWRVQHRTETAQSVSPAAKPDECLIKGNIGSKGDRIYHVPGGRWYDKTRIDTGKGERWFCSEAEARAAGWRPPK